MLNTLPAIISHQSSYFVSSKQLFSVHFSIAGHSYLLWFKNRYVNGQIEKNRVRNIWNIRGEKITRLDGMRAKLPGGYMIKRAKCIYLKNRKQNYFLLRCLICRSMRFSIRRVSYLLCYHLRLFQNKNTLQLRF